MVARGLTGGNEFNPIELQNVYYETRDGRVINIGNILPNKHNLRGAKTPEEICNELLMIYYNRNL